MKKAIKIVIILTIILALILCLVGCSATAYTNAYVKIGESWVDLEITRFTHYSNGVVIIELLDGTVMFVNSMNCILYKGELSKGN